MDNLGIQWKILLAQTVSFSLVFFVLWRFAYRPIFAMLEARRQKIPEGMADAEKIKAELDDLLDEIDDVLEENAEDFVRAYVQKGGQ